MSRTTNHSIRRAVPEQHQIWRLRDSSQGSEDGCCLLRQHQRRYFMKVHSCRRGCVEYHGPAWLWPVRCGSLRFIISSLEAAPNEAGDHWIGVCRKKYSHTSAATTPHSLDLFIIWQYSLRLVGRCFAAQTNCHRLISRPIEFGDGRFCGGCAAS